MEDCALVFDAIHGADGKDLTAGSYGFAWPSKKSLNGLKVGYSPSQRTPDDEREDLQVLKKLGCELVPVQLPREVPLRALTTIINVEAASVFDDLLREGHTEGWNTWDESFRAAQYVSAVDYVRIQRARSILMEQFETAIADVDLLINMNDLVHTNFTGHPSVVMPASYREEEGGARRPRPVVLTGHLNDDERLLAFGRLYQRQLDAHRQHPDLSQWDAEEI